METLTFETTATSEDIFNPKPVISQSKLSLGMTWPTEKIDIPEANRKDKTLSSETVTCIWKLPTICITNPNLPYPPQLYSPKPHLSSPVFEAGHINIQRQSQWKIQLNTAYLAPGDTKLYTSLFLWLLKDHLSQKSKYESNTCAEGSGPKFRCIYQFDILDDNGKSLYEKHSGIRTFRVRDCYGWPMFIPQAELKQIIAGIKSDTIVIQLELTMLRLDNTLIWSPSPEAELGIISPQSSSSIETLNVPGCSSKQREIQRKQEVRSGKSGRRKLGNAYRHVKMDVHCSGRAFCVNKSTLAEKSQVFYQLIQNADENNKDKETTYLEINDDSSTFETMLYYFYGKPDILKSQNFPQKVSLLKLGQKYEVEDLRRDIFSIFFKEATVQDAAEIALLVTEHMNLACKPDHFEQFRNFFLKNRVAIRETENFKANYAQMKDFLLQILSDGI